MKSKEMWFIPTTMLTIGKCENLCQSSCQPSCQPVVRFSVYK